MTAERKTYLWDRWVPTTLTAVIASAFGAGGTWMAMSKDIGRIQQDVQAMQRVDAHHEEAIANLRTEVVDQQQQFTERIHSLDTGQAIILEQLKEIRAAQERMDRNLEKLANGDQQMTMRRDESGPSMHPVRRAAGVPTLEKG